MPGLREARREDIPGMHRVRLSVRENVLTSKVSEADYVPAIEEHGKGWVVEERGEIVAFAVGDARDGNIWALFVHPDHESRGHGRRLHDAMVAWLWSRGLKRLWLTTQSDTRAESFYRAAGWKPAGRTEHGELRFELRAPGTAISAMLVLAAVLLVAAGPASAQSLESFGWFAQVVGACWEGTFPDGKTRHRHCYTSQFDRFIRGTTGIGQFSGDSVFAWDEGGQRIVYYVWGSDGAHGRHEAFYEGEDLAFPVVSRKEPGKMLFRSLWRRLDADAFEVLRQVPHEGGWRTEFTVRYRKVPSGSPR